MGVVAGVALEDVLGVLQGALQGGAAVGVEWEEPGGGIFGRTLGGMDEAGLGALAEEDGGLPAGEVGLVEGGMGDAFGAGEGPGA